MTMSDYIYLCSAGETFDQVALDVYGDEKYGADILCANPEHSGRAVFIGGERLRLPEIAIPEETYGVKIASDKAPWKE